MVWKKRTHPSIVKFPEFDGQKIFNQLMKLKEQAHLKTCQCCARLDTANGFLFTLVHETLRNEDVSKMNALDLYRGMLINHLVSYKSYGQPTVYGGDTLTDKMIDELKKAIERRIKGLPFTSTSRDHPVADILSDNTLFIIQVRFAIQASKSGISTQSYHPEEQNVLLTADYSFLVHQDVPIGQYFLYLNSDEKK